MHHRDVYDVADNFPYLDSEQSYKSVKELYLADPKLAVTALLRSENEVSQGLVILCAWSLPAEDYLNLVETAIKMAEQGKLGPDVLSVAIWPSPEDSPNKGIFNIVPPNSRQYELMSRARHLFPKEKRSVETIDKAIECGQREARGFWSIFSGDAISGSSISMNKKITGLIGESRSWILIVLVLLAALVGLRLFVSKKKFR